MPSPGRQRAQQCAERKDDGMSLLEEQRRSRRAQPKQVKRKPVQPKWSALDSPLATSHPNQVLTFFEWCQLNRISARTGRRIINSGAGPVVTQLSPHRIGITVASNAKWQASKARG
jgi:hypothetical protein